jgi:hypothetical protein
MRESRPSGSEGGGAPEMGRSLPLFVSETHASPIVMMSAARSGSRAPRVHRRLPSAARDVVAETTSSQIRARTIPLIGWRRRTVRPPRTTDAARTG